MQLFLLLIIQSIILIILTIREIHCNISSFESDYFTKMFLKIKENYLSKIPLNPFHIQCVKAIESQLSNQSIYDLIQYSGQGFSDAGLYSQCKAANYSYFLYVYKRLFKDSDYVMNFLRQKNSFYGLCIYQECFDFFNQSIVEQALLPIFDVDINSSIRKYSIKNSTVNTISSDFINQNNNIYAIIVASILVLFLIMKISIWLFRLICGKDKRIVQGNAIEFPNDDTLDDQSIESETFLLKSNEPQPLFAQNQSKEQREIIETKEMQAKVLKSLLSVLDLHENFNLLLKHQSKCYNNTNLDLISFIRALVFYLLTYNHNFYSFMQIPIKNLISLSFFNNFKMILFKMSTFAINAWVVLEGFILAFKFMSYCKKIMIKQDLINVPLKYILLFYLKSLSKVISFIIIVIIINLGVNQFSFFGVPPMFNFFTDVLNKRECSTNPAILFNPFGLLYFDYINQYFGFSGCYKYVYVCYNIHIWFIITLILIYLSMKLKSKIFDLIILVLFISNICLIKLTCGFDYSTSRTNTFSINYLYGETYSLKYPHLFINYYFIGVIGGMMYFYYIDIVTVNTFKMLNSNYNPLFFCFHLMKTIDSMINWVKNIILIICLIIMMLISVAFFFFYVDKWNIDGNPFIFPINGLYQFIDIYEKIIFVTAMTIVILISLISRNDSSFHSFYSSMLFRFVDRISFPLFCSMDTIIYIFYSTYHIVVLLNFDNTIFFALGLVILLIISSSVIIFTVEMPIRMIICRITSLRGDELEKLA